MRNQRFLPIGAVLAILLAVPGAAREPAVDLSALSSTIRALLPECTAATVCVAGRHGIGSGVVISTNGYVLTAGHVSGATDQRVTVIFPDGKTAPGRTLGLSEFSDTGLIKLDDPGPWPARPMAEANQSREGDWLFALGFPEGRFGQEERGVVLRVGRLLVKRAMVLQTDCKLLGGDSGGPLFNLRGEVVGIHSRISLPTDFNFHAPIEAFHREWKQLADGRAIRPTGAFLGVRMEKGERGVRVSAVVPDSAAMRAGLRAGDIITHIEDEITREPEEATLIIRTRAVDQAVKIDLLRQSEPMTVIVQLGRWPGLGEAEAEPLSSRLEQGDPDE
jgi:serine protease Do